MAEETKLDGEYSGPMTREETAEQIFIVILKEVSAGRSAPDKVEHFRNEIDAATGLKKGVLLARLVEELSNPDGFVVITFGETGKKGAFATGGEIQPAEIDRPIVAIKLNTDNPVCLKKRRKHLSLELLFSILGSAVVAQSLIEQRNTNGTLGEILSRREFNLANSENQ